MPGLECYLSDFDSCSAFRVGAWEPVNLNTDKVRRKKVRTIETA
jgi:hypothetical protein